MVAAAVVSVEEVVAEVELLAVDLRLSSVSINHRDILLRSNLHS